MISIQIPMGENWVRNLRVTRDVAAAMLGVFRHALNVSSPFSILVSFQILGGPLYWFTREEARWAERTLSAAIKRDRLMCGELMQNGAAA